MRVLGSGCISKEAFLMDWVLGKREEESKITPKLWAYAVGKGPLMRMGKLQEEQVCKRIFKMLSLRCPLPLQLDVSSRQLEIR